MCCIAVPNYISEKKSRLKRYRYVNVIIVLNIDIILFRDVTPCGLVDYYLPDYTAPYLTFEDCNINDKPARTGSMPIQNFENRTRGTYTDISSSIPKQVPVAAPSKA